MPKNDIDYNKTIIYKIVCNDLNIKECYVGSTTDFTKRKYHHKSACNKESSSKYNRIVYQTIRENGGWNNWNMIEIEKYPCNDNNEARTRERYWYEALNARLNSNNPIMSKKEYYEINKEEQITKSKLYRLSNIENLREQLLCECGKYYQRKSKSSHIKSLFHCNYINLNNDEITLF